MEAGLAQKPHGQAFLTRIEQMLPETTIQLVVRANGKRATTPHIARQAQDEYQVAASRGKSARPAGNAAQPKGSNTRRANRFQVLESLNATVESGKAELVNISIFGAQVVSKPALYPTQTIKIVLPDDNDTLRLTAHIAWSAFAQDLPRTDAHYRAGVAFVDAAREILADHCRRHCAKEPLALSGRWRWS